MFAGRLLLPGKGKQFASNSLGRFWYQRYNKASPAQWGYGGTLCPSSRGVGEISGLLEVIMQSNVSMFLLPANGEMEGDCWVFFSCLSKYIEAA